MILPDVLRGDGGEADPSAMARAFHGSPTQKPSILPIFMLATICARRDGDERDVLVRIDAAGARGNSASTSRACRAERSSRTSAVRRASARFSTNGLSALGSAPTLPFHSALSVMAWPLRLSSQGMIIGFFGEPSRPMVEAIGMPMSMCVAWIVAAGERVADGRPVRAFGRRSKSMPYFLNKPFLVRDDDGRTIGQRDDAEVELGGFGRVAGVGGADPAFRAVRRTARRASGLWRRGRGIGGG